MSHKDRPYVGLVSAICRLFFYMHGSHCAEQNAAGDISSVVSPIGDTYKWPARFAELKAKIKPRSDVLHDAWRRLERALDAELHVIQQHQHDIIPVVYFSDLQSHGGRFSEDMAFQVKKRGVVIVRNVIKSATARAWKQQVETYARNNPSHVGFPKDNPQVLELYWSKPQLQSRQHPNVHATMLALNHLYADARMGPINVSWDHALTYSERLRIRQPGDKNFVLHPHTDGGSIERWEDPYYRTTYDAILQGRWEEYDPWQGGDLRAVVNMTMYSGSTRNGLATIFRAFQGWVAVSAIGPVPDAGTLRVLPLLREATTHLLLRPFLEDVGAADFCGAIPGMAHDVTEKWHKKILRGMVAIPAMEPGDTVWWHPDVVHAVEGRHHGVEDSAVFYMPSLPLTEANAKYVRSQREFFLSGRTPPDFPPNDSELNFTGRGTDVDLTFLGRRMLGLDAFAPVVNSCDAGEATCRVADTARMDDLIVRCNTILGLDQGGSRTTLK